MSLTVYQYPQCGTCRNAVKWLKEHGAEVESINLFENPPSVERLTKLIEQSGLELKKWFNTSGEVYKEQKLKDKPGMSREDQIAVACFQRPTDQASCCDGWGAGYGRL